MKLAGQLAKELVPSLATLLIRSLGGDVAGTVGAGLLKIAERLADDYYQQQELVRNFQRIGEKIVQKLEPRFQQAVDSGGVDAGKVAQGLAHVLLRDGSAQALLDYNMQPDRLADAWRAAHPDRWNDFTSEERQLHSAALDDAARYLVEVAAELPGFQSRFSARIVQELGSVSEDLDRILTRFDDVDRWVKGKGLDDQNSRYEADYRCAVLRKFDYMELLGADIPPEARRHPLSVAYVSLSLLAAPEGQCRDGEEDAGGVSQGYEEILDQMGSANRRLLIRGEAGSGKSTLLRWTALQAAQPAISPAAEPDSFNRDPAGSACRPGDSLAQADALPAGSRLNAELTAPDAARRWRDCIPFLIRLRDYPQGKLPAVFDLPREVAKNVGSPPEAWVKSLLESGRALLLFDGVDEVPNDRRDDVRAEIANIIQAYPQNFFLVSTRPAAVPAGWLADVDFAEALINPMSESDRTAFIRKWHAAVQVQLHRDKRLSDEEDLPGLAERLTDKLRHSPPIARLATNPLLCGMICALHRERQEQLPETQVELCEDLCKTLLHRREKESRLDTEQLSPTYSRLNYEQKRAVVQELAHYMVRNGQSSVAADQADGCIAEALSRFAPHTSSKRQREDQREDQREGLEAADVRRALVERSGLLREPAPGRLDFIHNTLKEYLAGDRFAHLRDAGLLVDHALDSAWQPAIMFAAGSRVVGFADELIDRLLASADSPLARTKSAVAGWFGGSDTARARKLFAVRCGGDALHLSQRNRQRLTEVLQTTSRPLTVAESEAFAALGNFVVPFLKHDPDLPARTAVACVRTLRLIGTDEAHMCLLGYCGERRPTVVSELRLAVEPVELAVVQDELLPIVRCDQQVRQRLATESPAAVLRTVKSLDLEKLSTSDLTPLENLPNLQRANLRGLELGHAALKSWNVPVAKLSFVNSIGTPMTLIRAGEFSMGAPELDGEAWSGERPQHRVRITRSFLLSVYPVTQLDYERVMGENPSRFKGDDRRPVECVTWLDAVRFCNRLSEMESIEAYYRIDGERVSVVGRSGYRLPTEAEWEYACRAGTTTKWCGGDEEKELERFAWFEENSGRTTHPVGQKEANAWGLHDMHGNVWEWCEDAWHNSYKSARTDGNAWTGGGGHRVFRGGGWANRARNCRCAYRNRREPGFRSGNLGFRLVLAVSVKEDIRPFS